MRNKMMLIGLIAALGLVGSACKLDVERNADGSYQVEAIITEADIATELGFADNPDWETVDIDLKSGHALFEVTGPNEDDPDQIDEVTFRMELFVVDGHLGATVSDATWNGIDVPQVFVDEWNDEIAKDLERAAKQNREATLLDVDISEDQVRFELRIDEKRNRGNGNG